MRTLAILFTIALGAAIHAPESAAQPTPLAGCITISSPGMYQVTRNIDTDRDCIRVDAGFVTIDLGGFSIRGAFRTGEGIAIVTPGTRGTIVRNGTVQSFRTGVNLSSATGVLVEGIRAFDNDEAIVVGRLSIVKGNIVQDNDVGIVVGSNSIVTDNLAAFSRSGSGVEVGFNSTVTGNAAFSNAEHGIVVGRGSSIVTGNTVGDNDLAGIFAGEASTVMGNTSLENASEGIRVVCPSNVIGNTSSLNEGSDIVLVGRGCNNINNLLTVTTQPRE